MVLTTPRQQNCAARSSRRREKRQHRLRLAPGQEVHTAAAMPCDADADTRGVKRLERGCFTLPELRAATRARGRRARGNGVDAAARGHRPARRDAACTVYGGNRAWSKRLAVRFRAWSKGHVPRASTAVKIATIEEYLRSQQGDSKELLQVAMDVIARLSRAARRPERNLWKSPGHHAG